MANTPNGAQACAFDIKVFHWTRPVLLPGVCIEKIFSRFSALRGITRLYREPTNGCVVAFNSDGVLRLRPRSVWRARSF
jgi:hypothetical protein